MIDQHQSSLNSGDDEHVAAALESDPAQLAVIEEGLWAIQAVVVASPQRLEHTFPNDLSALLCFGRAFRQCRAATLLSMFGYQTEALATLRGAYEAASLGRMLSKEPELARRWLHEHEWVPDRKVRSRIDNFLEPGSSQTFGAAYRLLSAATHPTSRAALALCDVDDAADTWRVRLSSTFDRSVLSVSLDFVVATVGFVCAAITNAAASADVIPVPIRQAFRRVLTYAANMSGLELSDDVRNPNWDEAQTRHDAYLGRVRAAADLEAELDSNPSSWRNTRPT